MTVANAFWLLIAAGVAVGMAQHLGATFYLPDSNGGLADCRALVHNPLNGTLCVAGTSAGIVVIDIRAGRRLARIPIEGGPEAVACSPVTGDICYVCRDGDGTHVTCLDGCTYAWRGRVQLAGFCAGIVPSTRRAVLYALCDYSHPAIDVINLSGCRLDTTITLGFYPLALSYSERFDRLYCMGCDNVVAMDCATNRVLWQTYTGVACSTAVTDESTGRVYCTAGGDCELVVLDSTGHVIHRIAAPGGPAGILRDSCHGMLYCTNLFRREVSVIDCSRDSIVASIPVGAEPEDLVLDSPRSRLYCCNYGSCDITVIDTRTLTPVRTLPLDDEPTAICCVPRPGETFCLERSGTLCRLGSDGGSVVQRISVGESPHSLCLDAGGQRLYCTSPSHNAVLVLDAASGALLAEVPVAGRPAAACFEPRLARLYCADSAGSEVTAIDCRTNTTVADIRGPSTPAAIVLPPGAGKLYCADADNDDLLVIDCRTCEVKKAIPVGDCPALLCCDSAGAVVFCGSPVDGKVMFVDVRTDSVLGSQSVGTTVTALSWSASRDILCAVDEREPCVWLFDGRDGHQIAVVPLPDMPTSVCCVPNGDIYCGHWRTLYVVDPNTCSVAAAVAVDAGTEVLDCDPATQTLYCACPGGSSLGVVDTRTRSLVDVLQIGCSANLLGHSPATGRVYVASWEGSEIAVIQGAAAVKPKPMAPPVPSEIVAGARVFNSDHAAVLYDAAGRRVLDIHRGSNVLDRLAPGVYFVMADSSVAKVVLPR